MKIKTIQVGALLGVMFLVSCSSGPFSSIFGGGENKSETTNSVSTTDAPATPQKMIVGRWREVGTISIAAFHEDGTVEMTTGQDQVSGKFSFIGSNKLKMEMIGEGGKPLRPRVYDVAFSEDKMTWKDVNGAVSQFVRTK